MTFRPGVGKTTAIREVSRTLSETLRKRVVIVDTSNEIGGDGDIQHDGIGRARRMHVQNPEMQHRVMVSDVWEMQGHRSPGGYRCPEMQYMVMGDI